MRIEDRVQGDTRHDKIRDTGHTVVIHGLLSQRSLHLRLCAMNMPENGFTDKSKCQEDMILTS
jgi:hypothetical protein